MIRRINKLKNIGRFAELKSQGGTQGEFAKLNIIYARNAAGKSTFCDVLRSLSTGKPEYVIGRKRFGAAAGIEIEVLLQGVPAPKAVLSGGNWQTEPAGTVAPLIMIYDDRFVADNVLVGYHVAVEQRRNLYGLVIGAQGIALKQQVATAEQELNDATNALNIARTRLNTLLPNGWNIDSFRPLPVDENIDQRIRDANNELEAARRTKQNADAIRQRSSLQTTNPAEVPPDFAAILVTTLDDIALRAEEQIRQHLEQHSRGLGLEWVGQGHKAQVGTQCPYCAQEMKDLEILKAFRAFFSGELQEQQTAQQRIVVAIEQGFGSAAQQRLQQILHAHTIEKDWWRDAGGYLWALPALPPIENIVGAMEAVRAAIVGAIQRKQGHPSVPVSLSEIEQAALAEWGQVSAALNGYMGGLFSINTAIAERQRTAGTVDIAAIEGRIVQLNAQKRRHEADVVTAYTNYDTVVSTKATKERNKTSINEALRQQSELIFQQYGARINAHLQTFQADFRFVSTGVNFRGGPPSGELAVEILGTRISTSPEDARNPALPSLANTLSSGDRSVLSLAFFLAVIENDANIGNSVVVFDDPFHSQDQSRKRRTVEFVHGFARRAAQTIVLSHDLEFAREVAQATDVPVKTFSIDRANDDCEVTQVSLPSLSARAYDQDFGRLEDFAANPTAIRTDLRAIARSIRPVLEGYLRTKFPQAFGEREWLGNMVEKIELAQTGSPLFCAQHLAIELNRVKDYSKVFHHDQSTQAETAQIDDIELKSYVDQALSIVRC